MTQDLLVLPNGPGGGRHDLNLIVNAVYPIEISDGFLGLLFEVVGGQAASQDQHAVKEITRDAFQSQIRIAA
jgi:hypothetical protein